MPSLEMILLVFSGLLIISIMASKASGRYGIPALLLFLFIGMIAGKEGLGQLQFNDPRIAQYVGVVALAFILFSGGLETEWKAVRPVLREGILLSTFGVLFTALLTGLCAALVLKFSLIEGLLLGAIVSSTDAAAVFSVLRSRKVSLEGKLRPLLELESGSNDPMAVFLTIGIIGVISGSQGSMAAMFPRFVLSMGLGALMGYGGGRFIVYFINRIKLEYDGLYPVLTTAAILLVFAVTNQLGGNGFLAVYIAGLLIGNRSVAQKRYLIHFHSGLAWLMQIAMFLTLGMLVLPSRLAAVATPGLIMAAFLVFIARPVSVFITLAPSSLNFREKAFIAWVGLRGSVPIILATFPLLAGILRAEAIFYVVFFIVIVSTLLQGTTTSLAARLLGVAAPWQGRKRYPLELDQTDALNTRLIDYPVPYNSWMTGKHISEIGLPSDSLITLVVRNEDFLVPGGQTVIEQGDVLLTLVNNNNQQEIIDLFSKKA